MEMLLTSCIITHCGALLAAYTSRHVNLLTSDTTSHVIVWIISKVSKSIFTKNLLKVNSTKTKIWKKEGIDYNFESIKFLRYLNSEG